MKHLALIIIISSFSLGQAYNDKYCYEQPQNFCHNKMGVCITVDEGCTQSCIDDNQSNCCYQSVCCSLTNCDSSSSSISGGLVIFFIVFGACALFFCLIIAVCVLSRKAQDSQKQAIQSYNNNLNALMQQQQLQNQSVNPPNNQYFNAINPNSKQTNTSFNFDMNAAMQQHQMQAQNQSMNPISYPDMSMNHHLNPQVILQIPFGQQQHQFKGNSYL